MIEVISKHTAGAREDVLRSMFALRYHVFVETLGWPLVCEPGRELDQFDTEDAVYLVLCNRDGDVVASTRFLPTTGPNLLLDVFPHLVGGMPPVSPRVWEASRLVVDHRRERLCSCRNAAGELLCGIMEFALRQGFTHLVSVSDVRIERMLSRLGWNLRRLGPASREGGYDLAAEITPVSDAALEVIRRRTGIVGSVLAGHPATMKQAA